jgi:hypothetical protein
MSEDSRRNTIGCRGQRVRETSGSAVHGFVPWHCGEDVCVVYLDHWLLNEIAGTVLEAMPMIAHVYCLSLGCDR